MQIEDSHKHKIIGILKVIFGDDIKIYAYGSRVRSDGRPSSDLDLMIQKNHERLNLFDILEAKELLLASNLPFSVDINDYNSADPDFLKAVSKDIIELV